MRDSRGGEVRAGMGWQDVRKWREGEVRYGRGGEGMRSEGGEWRRVEVGNGR